jgi:hypothetical protein
MTATGPRSGADTSSRPAACPSALAAATAQATFPSAEAARPAPARGSAVSSERWAGCQTLAISQAAFRARTAQAPAARVQGPARPGRAPTPARAQAASAPAPAAPAPTWAVRVPARAAPARSLAASSLVQAEGRRWAAPDLRMAADPCRADGPAPARRQGRPTRASARPPNLAADLRRVGGRAQSPRPGRQTPASAVRLTQVSAPRPDLAADLRRAGGQPAIRRRGGPAPTPTLGPDLSSRRDRHMARPFQGLHPARGSPLRERERPVRWALARRPIRRSSGPVLRVSSPAHQSRARSGPCSAAALPALRS